MIRITQQREKCIGCNYCVELAYDRWRMSKRDGKCTLIDGKIIKLNTKFTANKGFF